ncbi:MAG: LysR family transcriptional regulator [Bdellovibrio sp.]
MDLRYAEAFYNAATTLHFGKASSQMGIAPSALTRQIQLFEESVGESLFVRSNRKVILTSKGKELLELLKPLLSQKEFQTLRLRVGGLAGVIDNHFWKSAKNLLNKNEMQITVLESTSIPALEKLLNGEIDIAFVNEKISNDLIQYHSLGKEELVVISKQRIQIKDLSNVPWIYCGQGNKLRSIAKTESTRQIKVSSINKVLDLVELGIGVGVVPISEKLSKRNFHISALPIKNRDTYLAILKYGKIPDNLRAVIAEIRNEFLL